MDVERSAVLRWGTLIAIHDEVANDAVHVCHNLTTHHSVAYSDVDVGFAWRYGKTHVVKVKRDTVIVCASCKTDSGKVVLLTFGV
jgi:hypothetical protein